MKKRRVLFIDDDESILSGLDRYFTKLGYETFTARSGREGIEKFHRVSPHVTVVDLHMPDLSGLAVLEELRSKRPIVIVLTGDTEVEKAVEAMRRGAENFLTKPISLPHLEVVVDKAAEKAALNRELRKLRARVTPALKRRLVTALRLALFLGVSAAVGILVGRAGSRPSGEPIRVPIDPSDTVVDPVQDAPFRPIPMPLPLDTSRGRR